MWLSPPPPQLAQLPGHPNALPRGTGVSSRVTAAQLGKWDCRESWNGVGLELGARLMGEDQVGPCQHPRMGVAAEIGTAFHVCG